MEVMFEVRLNTTQDVKDFTQIAGSFPRTASITAEHDNYRVDGKSILGLLSLNLSEPITIVISDNYLLDDKINELKKWSANL